MVRESLEPGYSVLVVATSLQPTVSLAQALSGRRSVPVKRFTEEQIIGFLHEADAGLPIKEPCRRQGFRRPAITSGAASSGGVSDAKRLKELESEKTRLGLKKLLAESMLEIEVTREELRKSGKRTLPSRAGAPHDCARLG